MTQEWGIGNGEWGLGNEEWEMRNGEWGLGIGDWGIGNVKLPSWMTVLIKLIDDLTPQWADLTVAMQTDIF